jgi:hypothetical protein
VIVNLICPTRYLIVKDLQDPADFGADDHPTATPTPCQPLLVISKELFRPGLLAFPGGGGAFYASSPPPSSSFSIFFQKSPPPVLPTQWAVPVRRSELLCEPQEKVKRFPGLFSLFSSSLLGTRTSRTSQGFWTERFVVGRRDREGKRGHRDSSPAEDGHAVNTASQPPKQRYPRNAMSATGRCGCRTGKPTSPGALLA